MSGIINRFLRKKSVRNEEALVLANRLSFGNSQFDRFLAEMVIGRTPDLVATYMTFQKNMLMLDIEKPVLMDAELGRLNQYLMLVQELMPDTFQLKWENRFPSERKVFLPPLILFPLIQHALSKGYNSMASQPVRIRLSGTPRVIQLEVSHRVNHYLEGQFQHALIQDFQKRLDYLFPEQHNLLLNSNSNICRATLTLHFK
ncbi:hypothetical protein HX021_20250 [Sphingobacterium sp. N143]|uniref:hypothetical protein n=1 Tax=Sphingobacterium sp. N143 TaxID=2746727 RepID=UPI002577E5E4|nr:hypothetical protein [Sphingobacterium sp. N143]MDM1296620.1 hypothetical protein [Sphingobacterium sp. N143]